MKRIRRITVELVRQRLVVRAGSDASAIVNAEDGAPRSDRPAALASEPVGACPRCGTEWVLLDDRRLLEDAATLPDLEAALTSLHLHLHSGEDGRVWVCQESLRMLAEQWRESG
ncbi:hypothetical protein [Terriglobus aquaticus]|uniref:Uncharacterized protein n=1 Tax=Terriglobus aquaticus TaxID=940139 RepID=A0ABW9KM06_9BACT|nr:hypothetical protein [Terriglobus aquaticus]